MTGKLKLKTRPRSGSDGYHNVRLGRLNGVNPGATYQFPDRKAAIRFADFEHAQHPKRTVIVTDPTGRAVKRYAAGNRGLVRK